MVQLTSCFCTLVFILLHILHHPSAAAAADGAATVYNVLSFGAKRNAVTDSTQAFLDAWAAACASPVSAEIRVPKGRYLLDSMAFKGDCNNTQITFRIEGTLVASPDYRVLGQANNWVGFEGVSGVTIIRGTLDAKGSALWACKLSTNASDCPTGATVSNLVYQLKSSANVPSYLVLTEFLPICKCRA